ncbi:pyrroline-5-carboxylate reductase [Bowdeniella nasicola]|uniref:Pyrroline-5-carboxylate reductase n=1 Tax=Bowdeniella nasicola TaxID=208480 RepID=A0A1Q5PZP9_9ACTO|nr:pyrroline-5-carboxylate reductase [Bowdeniella nasicola]OKL53108.1 pyrroline-5-carboxylate reductase [Bowdeniella nasicola]
MTTYGFIGAGNMASAIIGGMLAGGVKSDDIVVTDASKDARGAVADKLGVRTMDSNISVAECADVVILAVKPHIIPLVLDEVSDVVAENDPLIVSIAAGIGLKAIGKLTPKGTRCVRVMPNVNAMVGSGMAAVTGNKHATDEDVTTVVDLFKQVGDAIELDESDFSAYTALAGSSPAFVFSFIDALARGGVKNGIPKKLAVRIAAQAVLGSAQMVLDKADDGLTPADLVDMVSSPGGTTVAGTVAMEKAGFTPAVVDGVDAVVAKDKELGAK